MRRSYLKHVLRGELQATAHTSWWYHASGANKLAARTLAARKRYQIRVKDLTKRVRDRLHLTGGKVVDFHHIDAARRACADFRSLLPEQAIRDRGGADAGVASCPDS